MEREVFAWTVRRLRWLARIPPLPHLFEAACFTWTMLFRPRRRAAMEALEEEILGRHRCELGTHRLGGSAFRVRGKEIAHLYGIGLLDVHLTRTRADAFIAQNSAEPHHLLGRCAWVSLWIESAKDVPLAMELVDAAVEVGRRPQHLQDCLRMVSPAGAGAQPGATCSKRRCPHPRASSL